MPKISLIVSTYNRPDALNLVLKSLESQIYKDFEVLIADDGSGDETRQLIQTFQSQTKLDVKHIWQEDEGFRAASIRNKSVASSCGDYIVFLDGDCVVFPDFLKIHSSLKEKKRYIFGNRILLSQELTEKVLKDQIKIYEWNLKKWLRERINKNVNRFVPMLKIPMGFLRKISPRQWKGAKTCNLGVWKKDFLEINGFDEAFIGWGYEDSDLVARLINKGVFRLDGRFAIPVLHLWHPLNDRENADRNMSQLKKVLNSDIIRAVRGVDQYLN